MTLTWDEGGAHALLGPSGCGKTTLLNIISGLIQPSQGQVLFDGQDVTAMPPRQRNIAQVFQFPVVYDTMTVFDNLAFPLRNRGWKATDIKKRVHEVAEMLELTSDLRKRASSPSVDVKQKISLGRGLVRPDVAAILFDEPLTVIDPHLKWLLRRKLKEIHQQLKLSLIYVTHDQTEALTFADKVVVMTLGEVVQAGTAQELFEAPAHTFVGHFIGNPGMNFLPCTIEGGSARVGSQHLPLSEELRAKLNGAPGPFKLGIRPEFVQCSVHPIDGGHAGQLELVQPMGTYTMVAVRVGGDDDDEHRLWAKVRDNVAWKPGPLWIRLPHEHLLVYSNERHIA
jgi:glycerol transport system ATP-binding protein